MKFSFDVSRSETCNSTSFDECIAVASVFCGDGMAVAAIDVVVLASELVQKHNFVLIPYLIRTETTTIRSAEPIVLSSCIEWNPHKVELTKTAALASRWRNSNAVSDNGHGKRLHWPHACLNRAS